VNGDVVFDGLLGPTLPGEDRVQRLDRLARADERRRADELGEKLATEHSVVFEALIAGGEVVSRPRGADVQAREQVGPELGHPLSVSEILPP
jgi:hypothetical protein